MNQFEKSKIVRKWIADNQGKHFCRCGCSQAIEIKRHHYSRGVSRFINRHAARVENPMSGKFGRLNPNYKGGRYVNQAGYIMILIPGPGRSRYIPEHRLKMEKKLGRKLERGQLVHHKNQKKHDNRLRNLEVVLNRDHSSKHARRGETGFGLLKKRGKQGWWLTAHKNRREAARRRSLCRSQ